MRFILLFIFAFIISTCVVSSLESSSSEQLEEYTYTGTMRRLLEDKAKVNGKEGKKDKKDKKSKDKKDKSDKK